jgi:putative exporter of polyketide antibiotics
MFMSDIYNIGTHRGIYHTTNKKSRFSTFLKKFLVMQNTRGGEEKGQSEVLRFLSIGRLSTIHFVMVSAMVFNFVLVDSRGVLLFVLGISGI